MHIVCLYRFLCMMDSKSEDEESHSLEKCFHHDDTHYKVNYSQGRKAKEVSNLSLHS